MPPQLPLPPNPQMGNPYIPSPLNQGPFAAFLHSQGQYNQVFGANQDGVGGGPYAQIGGGYTGNYRVSGTQWPEEQGQSGRRSSKNDSSDDSSDSGDSGNSDTSSDSSSSSGDTTDDTQDMARGGRVKAYEDDGAIPSDAEDAVWQPQPGAPQVPPADDDEDDNRPHAPAPKEQSAARGGAIKAYDGGGDVEEEEDPGDEEADATPDEQADERRRADEERIAQDNDANEGSGAPSRQPDGGPSGGIPDDTTGSAGPKESPEAAPEDSEREPATGEHADPDKEDWVRNSAAALRSGYDWLKQQFGLADAVPGPDYAKGVANYHSGAGGAGHEDAEAVEAASDPERKLSDQQRTTKALSDVHDFYGDQSGEKVGSLLQRMRHLYHTYASHATVALENGDIAAGVKSANEALSNIPGPTEQKVELATTTGSRYGARKVAERVAAQNGQPTGAVPDDTQQGNDFHPGDYAREDAGNKSGFGLDSGSDNPVRNFVRGAGEQLRGLGQAVRKARGGAPEEGTAQAAPLVMTTTDTASGKVLGQTPTQPQQLIQHLSNDFDKQVEGQSAPAGGKDQSRLSTKGDFNPQPAQASHVAPVTIYRGGRPTTYIVPKYEAAGSLTPEEQQQVRDSRQQDNNRLASTPAADIPKIVGTYSDRNGRGTTYKLSDGRSVTPATYNAMVKSAQAQGRQASGGARGANPETQRHNEFNEGIARERLDHDIQKSGAHSAAEHRQSYANADRAARDRIRNWVGPGEPPSHESLRDEYLRGSGHGDMVPQKAQQEFEGRTSGNGKYTYRGGRWTDTKTGAPIQPAK